MRAIASAPKEMIPRVPPTGTPHGYPPGCPPPRRATAVVPPPVSHLCNGCVLLSPSDERTGTCSMIDLDVCGYPLGDNRPRPTKEMGWSAGWQDGM